MMSGILWSMLSLMVWNAHPIHVTMSEVVYDEKNKSLQMTHKIFIDDLETHLEMDLKAKGQDVQLRLNTPREHPQVDLYLSQYVATHFRLLINGKQVKAQFLGKEYEDFAAWIYVEGQNVPKPKSLDLTDSFLIDLYEDQSNLVNFELPGKTGSMRFARGKVREAVNW
jgi:hypothetical protein